MKTVFLRALEAEDKAAALLHAIRESSQARGRSRFEVDAATFAVVPRSPFAYWVSDQTRAIFGRLPALESEGREARVGDHPGDSFRYLRLAWEVSAQSSRTWQDYQKGGSYSPYYCDIHLKANWDTARSSYRGFFGRPGRSNERPSNYQYFLRPGICWPLRTNGLSLRAMPAGCVFSHKGPTIFVEQDSPELLLPLLALGNSKAFSILVALQLARTELAQSYEVGLIQSTPIPPLSHEVSRDLTHLAHRAWSLKRALDTRTETSHAFTLPSLLQVAGHDLSTRSVAWSQYARAIEKELGNIQTELDARCFALYGIDEEDIRAIAQGFGGKALGSEAGADDDDAGKVEDESDQDSDDGDEQLPADDQATLAKELFAWAIGVAVGRFDVRLATGARVLASEPQPFESLPACSPGMLGYEQGNPATYPDIGYPLHVPESAVLVDDPGHRQDLEAAVHSVFEIVFGADAGQWWSDVAAQLDPKGHEPRTWIAGSFFEYHLKRYSKSRRKAPVLWQLGIPSGRYSVWLYAHRISRDSFFQLQNDVVGPKLSHEERQLSILVANAGTSPSATERKAISAQEAFVEELRGMLDEVKRVAPLWNPNLDDGVVLTMAPLWRLVTHKPWQRELKAKLDELVNGRQDWSNISMHFWPERIVQKCKTDHSLAVAHGLEEAFWVEGADGKWKPRHSSSQPVDILNGERTSPAVKAALDSLLKAPSTKSKTGMARRKGSR